MGRPKKNTVQSSSLQERSATVVRVVTKLREFTLEQAQAKTVTAFVVESPEDKVVVENATVDTLSTLVTDGKFTLSATGTYKIVVGKRGRPCKVPVVQNAGASAV